MASSELDFKSVEVQDELHPDIWPAGGDSHLHPEVRRRLIKIALNFYQELSVPQADLKDITFTGSLANFNWSKYSDVDLHLIVDFKDVASDVDLVVNYFKARKSQWNDLHDITVHGFDVEVYVQDDNEPHFASGLYSVLYGKWLVSPKPGKPFIDKEAIRKKAKFFMGMIDDLAGMLKDEEYEEVMRIADKVQEKLRNMRSSGLERAGEYSSENLAFKLLRRNEYIKKLYDLETEAYDSLMTL